MDAQAAARAAFTSGAEAPDSSDDEAGPAKTGPQRMSSDLLSGDFASGPSQPRFKVRSLTPAFQSMMWLHLHSRHCCP